MRENRPAMIQTAVIHNGEPVCAAMVAGFINTPDPIILPMIIETAGHRPMVFFNCVASIKNMLSDEDMKRQQYWPNSFCHQQNGRYLLTSQA